MDYAGQDKTSWLFRQLLKYTVAGAALVLALLAFFRG